jgi:hypothetical protein
MTYRETLRFTLHSESPPGARSPHLFRAQIFFASFLVGEAWADSEAEACRRAEGQLGYALQRLVFS